MTINRKRRGTLKVCHVCKEEKPHASWKAYTCDECLSAGYKWCNECKNVKQLTDFSLQRGKPASCCKPCKTVRSQRSYDKTGYMDKPEVKQRRKEAKDKYYNTPHGRAKVNKLVRDRQRNLYNTDEAYRKARIVECHTRRSAEGTYTADEFKAVKEMFENKCAYCSSDGDITVDHLLAIACGGTNYIENIVPSCLSCNCSKGAKEWRTWYKEQVFYSPINYNRLEEYEKGGDANAKQD